MKKIYNFAFFIVLSLLLSLPAYGQDNILQGGDMESDDHWNITLVGGSEEDFPNFTFGYTNVTPEHGEGGALYISSETRFGNLLFWQEVVLEGGKTYHFDAAFKDLGGLENFWGEIAISDQMPVAGEDWGVGVAFSGFNTWDGCGPDVDGTFAEDGCIGDGSNVITIGGEGEQTLIFGMKFGTWDGNMDILIDEATLILTEDQDFYDVTFNVDMSDAEGFDPEMHEVFISGSMAGWAEPGTNPNFRMSRVDESSDFHTLTVSLVAGNIEYKYFFVEEGETGWGGEEWAGDPNRSLSINGDTETNDVYGDQPVTSVDEPIDTPMAIGLNQNYPNPFNPSTNISFDVPAGAGLVTLRVYNMLGQEVATLVNGSLSAGSHNVQFNAGSLSSGIYIYQLQTESQMLSRRMTLIK